MSTTPPSVNLKRYVAFWFDEADEARIADLTWHGVIDSKIARGDYLEMRDVDVTYIPGLLGERAGSCAVNE